MTIEEAKNLGYREILHMSHKGGCERWRVNGMIKLWKRSQERIRIPLAHGLYDYGYLTERNVCLFHKESDCPNPM